LRKAKAMIAASGAENVFAMVQGKLWGNEIVECGLVAQVKAPKPVTTAGAWRCNRRTRLAGSKREKPTYQPANQGDHHGRTTGDY
jgi:hypothetical protein